MTRKLKRPDGAVCEEFVAVNSHHFENGKLVDHVLDPMDGEYTGRFLFMFKDKSCTRWYTENSAPQWLLALYKEATA